MPQNHGTAPEPLICLAIFDIPGTVIYLELDKTSHGTNIHRRIFLGFMLVIRGPENSCADNIFICSKWGWQTVLRSSLPTQSVHYTEVKIRNQWKTSLGIS